VLYHRIKNHNLPWFQTSIYLRLKLLILRILNYYIPIVKLIAAHKVEFIMVINHFSDGLLTNMWKEILVPTFENVVLLSIGEDNLFGVVGDFTGHASAPFGA